MKDKIRKIRNILSRLLTVFLPVMIAVPIALSACAPQPQYPEPSALQIQTTLWIVNRAFEGANFTTVLAKEGQYAIFGLLKNRGWAFTILSPRNPINQMSDIAIYIRNAGIASGEDTSAIVQFMKEKGWEPIAVSSIPQAIKETVQLWLKDVTTMTSGLNVSLFLMPAFMLSPEGSAWENYLDAPTEIQ